MENLSHLQQMITRKMLYDFVIFLFNVKEKYGKMIVKEERYDSENFDDFDNFC